jgi:hypothetical protein
MCLIEKYWKYLCVMRNIRDSILLRKRLRLYIISDDDRVLDISSTRDLRVGSPLRTDDVAALCNR